ncbi:MFS transporter [Candidatus Paracaedibacter symbiosus]|uniref:MFS transporter n=1 Tax=Candidatus Paracaedibacter symbiosus TaxID=244582 RepID=UPI000509AE09|nr:MFS transporter [Candidatus Paracaedibacter symbiosus]
MDHYRQKILGIPRGWLVVICGALFYCYQFILRVSPNVMHDELVKDLMMDASMFGTMIAFYSWSYAAVQLPLGIALDRFGTGKLITLATFICALSCFVFASTKSFYVASFAQLLMGLGSACGFLGAVKLGTIWFPPGHVARVIAVILVFGTLGAALGGSPLSALTDAIGWQTTMHLLGIMGLVIGGALYMVIGRHKDPIVYEPSTSILAGLKEVLSNPQAWLISTYGMLMYVPITLMGVAWGVPYILSVYDISEQTAATVITTMFVGAAVGSPLFSLYSDKIKKRSQPMMIGAILALTVNAIIILAPNVPLFAMYLLFFIAGFAYTAKSLSFASICEIMPKTSSGVAVGFINTITMANGAVFHPLIGKMLDYNANDGFFGEVDVYSQWDYRFALSIIPISIALSVLVAWFIKETHHESNLTEAEKGAVLLSDIE